MVAPERDTPGIIARHWAEPDVQIGQQRELRSRRDSAGLSFSRSTHSSTAPPTISIVQTIQTLNSTPLMNAVRERADDRGGQERDQHADDEAARRLLRERADRDRPQPLEIDRQDRQDRAELDQHHEGLAERVVVEAEEVLEQQQVAGRRNGEKFGQALDHAENDGLEQVEQHAEGSEEARFARQRLSRKAGQGATEKVAASVRCVI